MLKIRKIDEKIVKEWLDQVYFPNMQYESVLLVDSWGCQNERFLLNAIPAGKKNEKFLPYPRVRQASFKLSMCSAFEFGKVSSECLMILSFYMN